ncbi:MAG: YesL family protein [Clostridia bacterium]|nr:YesL family protein [Clostridia bacterium]
MTGQPQTETVETLPPQTALPETTPDSEGEEAKWSDVALPLVGSFLVLGPACMLFLLFLFMNGFSPLLVLGVTLFTVLTFGPATTALTRIIRNFVSGKPCFIWSDFKKAFRQSYLRNVLVGLVDLLISCIMAYAVYAYYGALAAESTFVNQLLFFISVAILILYACVRHYIYLMQTTFDLKVVHVMKNSLIMALYGLIKNVGAFLLNAVFYLIFFLGYTAWFAPVIVLMPLAILFSFPVFFSTYIVYPDFYAVMIKPEEEKQGQDDGLSPIFIDRG